MRTMRVERIPTLGDNYTYLIICPETNEAAVVDAPELDPVVAAVDRLGGLSCDYFRAALQAGALACFGLAVSCTDRTHHDAVACGTCG